MTAPTDPMFPGSDNENAYGYRARGLTVQEHAAIMLKVPNSGTVWLDEMIRKAVHRDVTVQVAQGLLANDTDSYTATSVVRTAYKVADVVMVGKA